MRRWGFRALGEADRRGYAVDKTYVADMVEAALGSRDKMMAASLVPNPALRLTRPLAGAEHGAGVHGGCGAVVVFAG